MTVQISRRKMLGGLAAGAGAAVLGWSPRADGWSRASEGGDVRSGRRRRTLVCRERQRVNRGLRPLVQKTAERLTPGRCGHRRMVTYAGRPA